MKIYIIGAGTLGQFVCDMIESIYGIEIGGFFDDGYPSRSCMFGYQILGKIADLDPVKHEYLAIGIGDPNFRKKFYLDKISKGFKFPTIIHPSVVVSRHSQIGDAVLMGPNGTVLSGSIIEVGACLLSCININQDVRIGPYCLIGAGVVIGNNAKVGEGCHIGLGNVVPKGFHLEDWRDYGEAR